jgi:hypothetical protein
VAKHREWLDVRSNRLALRWLAEDASGSDVLIYELRMAGFGKELRDIWP